MRSTRNGTVALQILPVLFNFISNSNISVMSQDTPTFFPSIQNHRPSVLPHQSTTALSLNELSSENNPVFLKITNTPISSSPPPPSYCINWKKFSRTLDQILKKTSVLNFTENINKAISHSTHTFQSALKKSKY